MLINEIFKSISGESIQAGRPAVFIRTFSCPLRCKWCDSLYAVEGDDYKEMSVSEIVDEVIQLNCNYIVLTGGESLIQHDVMDLIYHLIDIGCHVEIETSGAVDIDEVVRLDNVTVTMDWKCSSSGMIDKMSPERLYKLRAKDVVKCVVGSLQDLEEMHSLLDHTAAQIFVSPVFGMIEPKDIVEYILNNNLNTVRFQLQLHKYVWPSDMRGV